MEYKIIQVSCNKFKIQRKVETGFLFWKKNTFMDLGNYRYRYFSTSYYDSLEAAKEQIKKFEFKEKIVYEHNFGAK